MPPFYFPPHRLRVPSPCSLPLRWGYQHLISLLFLFIMLIKYACVTVLRIGRAGGCSHTHLFIDRFNVIILAIGLRLQITSLGSPSFTSSGPPPSGSCSCLVPPEFLRNVVCFGGLWSSLRLLSRACMFNVRELQSWGAACGGRPWLIPLSDLRLLMSEVCFNRTDWSRLEVERWERLSALTASGRGEVLKVETDVTAASIVPIQWVFCVGMIRWPVVSSAPSPSPPFRFTCRFPSFVTVLAFPLPHDVAPLLDQQCFLPHYFTLGAWGSSLVLPRVIVRWLPLIHSLFFPVHYWMKTGIDAVLWIGEVYSGNLLRSLVDKGGYGHCVCHHCCFQFDRSLVVIFHLILRNETVP